MPRNVLLALTLLALPLGACNRVTLHKSFGQRVKEFNTAQANAHPAHDAVVRGDEAVAIIESYTATFAPTNGGGGGSTGSGIPGVKTAGVPPLH